MTNDVLLISCPGGDGGLFMVSGETCVRLSSRATTGMSVSGSELIFAYQDNDGKSVRVIKDGRTKEIKLGESRLDLHDVFSWHDKVYVAATETNCVVSLDENYMPLDSWCLPGENDSSHLNSAIFYDDRLLVSVFGRFKHHREYKDGTVGRGEIIDIKTGETFIDGLSQPHSLTVIDDLLYLCNSEGRQIRVYRKSELLQQIDVPGYARGMAVGGENMYVGISLSRNDESPTNDINTATVIVLDRRTTQHKGTIPLPCREIYSIRTVTDVMGLFPHLLVDLVDKNAKADELLAQYQRGYESYLRENTSLMHKIGDMKDINELLSKELENTLTQIENMRQSKSWRFTKPFRIISDKIRR